MDGEIDPDALADRLEESDLQVVDIRQPAAFDDGHIPGSVNVPFGNLPDEIDRIADADRVVTVCPHGKASVKAARLIGSYREFDGRVESLRGGLEAWDGPLAASESEASDAPF